MPPTTGGARKAPTYHLSSSAHRDRQLKLIRPFAGSIMVA